MDFLNEKKELSRLDVMGAFATVSVDVLFKFKGEECFDEIKMRLAAIGSNLIYELFNEKNNKEEF